MKVELDLSNYVEKSDLKNAVGVDISKFAKKVDLASLEPEIDKLDICKLETTPIDLSKLSDVIENEVLKKTGYNELIKKANALQTADASNLVKNLSMTKIGETKIKILDHDHAKFITSQEFNKLTTEKFNARLKQLNLAAKADFDDFVEKTDFDNKLKNLNKKLPQIKQNMYWLNMNWISYQKKLL